MLVPDADAARRITVAWSEHPIELCRGATIVRSFDRSRHSSCIAAGGAASRMHPMVNMECVMSRSSSTALALVVGAVLIGCSGDDATRPLIPAQLQFASQPAATTTSLLRLG